MIRLHGRLLTFVCALVAGTFLGVISEGKVQDANKAVTDEKLPWWT
jgi:hypothetical protein